MDANLKAQYITNARFDYVKLRWRYAGVDFTEEVREVVLQEFIKLQATAPHTSLKDPRFTVLDPSPNKPDGIFIVELFGYAAECVKGLPASWLQNVTYAHCKAYAHGMRYAQVEELQLLYLRRKARRSASLINGGTAGRSKKGTAMPGIRIGSRKSGWHGVIYPRKGFAPGFEGRFRDEQVHQRTLAALDFWNMGEMPDMAAWLHFLRSLAAETATAFETDAMQREFQLEDFLDEFGPWARQSADQLTLEIDDEPMLEPPTFDGSEYAD